MSTMDHGPPAINATAPRQREQQEQQEDRQEAQLQRHYTGTIASSHGGQWTYSSRHGFDLTHSALTDDRSLSPPANRLTLTTTTAPITLDAHKCALVIVDMQNYFLHEAFGRAPTSAGRAALQQLVAHAIPAARRCGMQVVWLNWGLTEGDLDRMPPGVLRAFGFWCTEAREEEDRDQSKGGNWKEAFAVDKHGKRRQAISGDENIEHTSNGTTARTEKTNAGLGHDCGVLTDPTTGDLIPAGRLLMRDSWNAALHPPLDAIYTAGTRLPAKPDVWLHKNRMSGLWGGQSDNPLEPFLRRDALTTLLFAGVNTDQCVAGTLSDAFSKGFDCVLLRDGCGTTSPACAQLGIEFNASGTWGFNSSCVELDRAVERMGRAT